MACSLRRASPCITIAEFRLRPMAFRSYDPSMERLARAALICAAFAFGFAATPSIAQTAPDQSAQQPTSVPPAPPPERQTSPSVPPPFPPMPTREPRHRFVDMGGHHRSSANHRATRTRHSTSEAHHRSTKTGRRAKSSRHEAAHGRHHRATEHRATAPAMSKKAIRQCHGMTYRQLLRHKNCAALLQSELGASEHSKHRSKKHTAASKRHKSASNHDKRHKASARHRKR